MTALLHARLLTYSGLRVFLDFSHIVFLSLVGFSVTALAKDSSLPTIAMCLTGAVLAIGLVQLARSMTSIDALKIGRLRTQMHEYYKPSETKLVINLAYLFVLSIGSVCVLLVLGSWEALVVMVIGNGLAWQSGKFFLRLTAKSTREATRATRLELRPWRQMSFDFIPLITFILGLAIFPDLLGIRAILIYLVLRQTCRRIFQLSLQIGMRRHMQSIT
ncbi:MAG: hypothetical protein NXI27_00975 [Alphaproteobacteria bacterium]|nr:hypothetical protein [Alphaproteobacteria bacterium]